MGNEEEKNKHRVRRKKVRSVIAGELETAKFRQRVIKDKRGRSHVLDDITHKKLVDLIQELDDGS